MQFGIVRDQMLDDHFGLAATVPVACRRRRTTLRAHPSGGTAILRPSTCTVSTWRRSAREQADVHVEVVDGDERRQVGPVRDPDRQAAAADARPRQKLHRECRRHLTSRLQVLREAFDQCAFRYDGPEHPGADGQDDEKARPADGDQRRMRRLRGRPAEIRSACELTASLVTQRARDAQECRASCEPQDARAGGGAHGNWSAVGVGPRTSRCAVRGSAIGHLDRMAISL